MLAYKCAGLAKRDAVIPDSWCLVQGTFLLPNGSISNITGWKLVDPPSGENPRLFCIQKIQKSLKRGLKFQGRVILGKKGPCQECPGTRPNGFLPKSVDFQVWGQKIYPISKMPRPKMIPWSTSIHWIVLNLLFHLKKHEKSRTSIKSDSKSR